jgi:hypothetical protein
MTRSTIPFCLGLLQMHKDGITAAKYLAKLNLPAFDNFKI